MQFDLQALQRLDRYMLGCNRKLVGSTDIARYEWWLSTAGCEFSLCKPGFYKLKAYSCNIRMEEHHLLGC